MFFFGYVAAAGGVVVVIIMTVVVLSPSLPAPSTAQRFNANGRRLERMFGNDGYFGGSRRRQNADVSRLFAAIRADTERKCLVVDRGREKHGIVNKKQRHIEELRLRNNKN